MAAMRFPVLLAIAALACARVASAAEQIAITYGESTLPGILFKPDGAGPFPAAVALHHCGGLVTSAGTVGARFIDWGERLAAAGIAVLFPDSFGARGLGTQCRVRDRKVRSSQERVADAYAARHWLQEQPWVVKNRVSLIGWAEGGRTSLFAVRPRAGVRDSMPDFRTAVAFYPGLRRLTELAWSARVPTLILIGGADDFTPASACERMVAGAHGRSARTSIVVYPGAYHDFDRPNFPVRIINGFAFAPDRSGNAHFGTDPAARADALKRVPAWIMR